VRRLLTICAVLVLACTTYRRLEEPLVVQINNRNWYANTFRLFCSSGALVHPVMRGLTFGETRTVRYRLDCRNVHFRVEGLGGRITRRYTGRGREPGRGYTSVVRPMRWLWLLLVTGCVLTPCQTVEVEVYEYFGDRITTSLDDLIASGYSCQLLTVEEQFLYGLPFVHKTYTCEKCK
jgi:hypothetical protein